MVRDLQATFTPATGAVSSFKISGKLRIPRDQFIYQPSNEETFKWAWIQFISLHLLLAFFAVPVIGWFYKRQVVTTMLSVDGASSKTTTASSGVRTNASYRRYNF